MKIVSVILTVQNQLNRDLHEESVFPSISFCHEKCLCETNENKVYVNSSSGLLHYYTRSSNVTGKPYFY